MMYNVHIAFSKDTKSMEIVATHGERVHSIPVKGLPQQVEMAAVKYIIGPSLGLTKTLDEARRLFAHHTFLAMFKVRCAILNALDLMDSCIDDTDNSYEMRVAINSRNEVARVAFMGGHLPPGGVLLESQRDIEVPNE